MADSQKFIVITGASDGLGLRLAHLFSGENVHLLLTGRKPLCDLDHDLPPNATYLVADQSRSNCGELILDQVTRSRWPRIDNIILNAGVGFVSKSGEETSGQIIDTLEINLLAPISILHQLSKYFLAVAPGGSVMSCITFIGSPARKGASKFASYAASKAGLSGLARALESEWQERADVQIIHPGPTNTQMQKKAGLNLGKVQKYFINPDYSAREIKKLIDTRKPNANVGMPRYYMRLSLSKLGIIPPTKTILPQ